jgi:uncharacterized membrane protein
MSSIFMLIFANFLMIVVLVITGKDKLKIVEKEQKLKRQEKVLMEEEQEEERRQKRKSEEESYSRMPLNPETQQNYG